MSTGGTLLNPTLSSGGTLAFQPVLWRVAATVLSGATLTVSSGVTATGVSVQSGGLEVVQSGGTAAATIDEDGHGSSGGKALGDTVASGGHGPCRRAHG